MSNKPEYEQAKHIITDLEVGKQSVIKVKNLSNFRKYLCELTPEDKLFTTRLFNNQLLVIRLK